MPVTRFVTSVSRFSKWVGVFAIALVSASVSQGAEIAWHKDLAQATRESAKQNKSMLIMVGAKWCGFCHKMLQQTFPDPAITARINSQFVPVLLDADEQAELVGTLNVTSMPTMLVVRPDRKIVGRMAGFQSARQLDAQLATFNKPVPATSTPGKKAQGNALAAR